MHSPWRLCRIRWRRRPEPRANRRAFFFFFCLIFDDAALPLAFVSSFGGRSCWGARCYPRFPSPKKENLRPRAAAPQTLNRSIRHTVLVAAGVLSCGCGCVSCPMGQRRAHYCKHTLTAAHHTAQVLLCSTPSYKDNGFILLCHSSRLSRHRLMFRLLPVDPSLCFECPPPPFPPGYRSALWKYPQGLFFSFLLPICSVADFDYAATGITPQQGISKHENEFTAKCCYMQSWEENSNTGLH